MEIRPQNDLRSSDCFKFGIVISIFVPILAGAICFGLSVDHQKMETLVKAGKIITRRTYNATGEKLAWAGIGLLGGAMLLLPALALIKPKVATPQSALELETTQHA